MSTHNIIDWCDKYIYLVNLLKQNYDSFMKNEVDNIDINYEDLRTVEANTVCISRLIDKYMFIIAMMSPSHIYDLFCTKINLLRNSMVNVHQMQLNNNNQVEDIVSRLSTNFIHQHLK